MKTVFKSGLICLTALFFTSLCIAQNKKEMPGQKDTFPVMWVDKFRSIERVATFGGKHYLISQATRIEQTLEIYYPDFFKMIDYFDTAVRYKTYAYLRTYIAMYPREGEYKVPPTWGNKLTLIFAPVGSDNKDLDWFTIEPGKNFNPTYGRLDSMTKVKWVNRYLGKALPSIIGTIDHDDPDNQFEGLPSDTRSILYERKDIDSLRSFVERVSIPSLNKYRVKAFL